MNGYRDTVKKRLKWAVALNCLSLTLIGLTFWISRSITGSDTMLNGMVTGFQVGIFLGLQAVMVYGMMRYKKALNDDPLLKSMYIQETDERFKWIQGNIGSTGLKIILSGIMLAMVVAGFFNLTVMLTLFGAMLFVLFTQLGLKLYYQNKY